MYAVSEKRFKKRTYDELVAPHLADAVRDLSCIFRRIPLELWLIIGEHCIEWTLPEMPTRACDSVFSFVEHSNGEHNWLNLTALLYLLNLTGCPTGFMNDLVDRMTTKHTQQLQLKLQFAWLATTAPNPMKLHKSVGDLSPATRTHILLSQAYPLAERHMCARCMHASLFLSDLSNWYLPASWVHFLPSRDKRLCRPCFFYVYKARLRTHGRNYENSHTPTPLFLKWLLDDPYGVQCNKTRLINFYSKTVVDDLVNHAVYHKKPLWTYRGRKYYLMFDYTRPGVLGGHYCEPLPDILMHVELNHDYKLTCNNLF